MKFVFSFVMLIMSMAVSAQNSTVYLLGGSSGNQEIGDFKPGSPTVQFIYERSFSKNWNLDTSVTYSADRSRTTGRGHTVQVAPFVEYFPNDKVFVGGTLMVTKNSTPEYGDVVNVNPTFEAGLVLPYKRLTVEPYVQASTPDLVQKSRWSNIGGGTNLYFRLKKNFGLRGSLYAFRNYWKDAEGNRYRGTSTGILAGVYYKF